MRPAESCTVIEHLAKTLRVLANCSRDVLAIVLAYGGFLWLRHRLRRPRILVLAYRRVTPDDELCSCAFPEMHVSTSHFEKQLGALRRFYRIVSLVELEEILGARRPLREHVAVITFDGGYRDNYEHALRILERQGVPATFFLSTGFVDERRSPWFDRLADIMRAWDSEPAARQTLRSSMPARLAEAFECEQGASQRLRRAAAYLDSLPIRERRSIMKRLSPRRPQSQERPHAQALQWSEVRDMAARGMDFGAHGITQTTFTRMTASEARHEMLQSMRRVGDSVGRPVAAFAYPRGAVDDDIVQLARDAGVRMAFTLEARENHPDDDPLCLGRRAVESSSSTRGLRRFSSARFWSEITGCFDLFRRRTHARTSAYRAATDPLDWTGPLDAVPQTPPAARWAGSGEPPTTDANPAGSATIPTQVPARAGRTPHDSSVSSPF